jgi:hypothetical protein
VSSPDYKEGRGDYYLAAGLRELRSELSALQEENERLRKGLERIAYWEGAPTPPHKGFDFDSHLDCSVKEGCPAMVAHAALTSASTSGLGSAQSEATGATVSKAPPVRVTTEPASFGLSPFGPQVLGMLLELWQLGYREWVSRDFAEAFLAVAPRHGLALTSASTESEEK